MARPHAHSLLATLTLGLALAGPVGCGDSVARPNPGYEDFRVTGFELVNQDAEPTDESILDGRYTVLAFIFTNCPIYCPAMGRVMRRVQDETAGTNSQLISVSVDSVNDTPEVLKAYAESLGADADRWTFLTGEPEMVRSLAEEQLKLGIAADPSRPITLADGSTMDFLDHPTRLVLIAPGGQVLGMYSYARDEEIDTLIQRVRRLATR